MRSLAFLCLAGLVIALAFLSAQQRSVLAIVGSTIYPAPNVEPIYDGVVVLEDGKMTAVGGRSTVKVPAQSTVIDARGMFILAGLQNSHVHFTPPGWMLQPTAQADQLSNQLRAMLTRWGFTTVIDTGSDPTATHALRRRIESGEIDGPRILTAGLPLYPPNGLPFYLQDIPPDLLKMLPQPATASEATAVMRSHPGDRDLLKLFVGSWVKPERGGVLPMPPEIAMAAAREAHRTRKLVFAHPSNVAGLEVALRARVDVLAHALDDPSGLTDAHLRQMTRQNMAMVPTLKLFKGDADVVDEVRQFARAGGQILFGTDVGFLTDHNPTEEYEHMARVGLTWRDILASLTTNPATRFGESRRRGRVNRGMDADVVVLKADPAQDVRAFANVSYTIRGGQLIYNASK